MGGIIDYMMFLTKVSFSLYETAFNFTYSIDCSVPYSTTTYYTNRINEAMNFSSIITGVTKDFYLKTSFLSLPDQQEPLGIMKLNSKMKTPYDKNFMAYQRDHFDFYLSNNISKFRPCEEYFNSCKAMNSTAIDSSIGMNTVDRDDTFILNRMLVKQKEPTTNTTLAMRFTTEAITKLVHFKMSNSLYYLIVFSLCLHSALLLYNVVILLLKRKDLQKLITKAKTQ